MVRVRVQAPFVEDRVDHGELTKRDAVTGFELRAIARDGHHPFVVRRKEDRTLPPLRVVQQVLHEPAFVLEWVRARVPVGHRARRLAESPRVGIEGDNLHTVRRERARDR